MSQFQRDSLSFRSFLPDANMADVQLPGERGKNFDSLCIASVLVTFNR